MSKLSLNLKYLRKQKSISQSDLAELLNTSQTSVAHYEKGDRQPTIDTLINISSIFNVSLDELVGNTSKRRLVHEVFEKDKIIFNLTKQLLSKNSLAFYNKMSELVSEVEMEVLIDVIIKEVLYEIGEQWEKGYITEADEHYATNIVRKTMNALSFKYPKEMSNKRAISLSVHSEQHTLGIELVSAYLEKNGVETLYLGNNVPLMSLNRLIEDYKPDYLFVSITLREHINSLVLLLDNLEDKYIKNIFIGGKSARYAKFIMDENRKVSIISSINEISEFIR